MSARHVSIGTASEESAFSLRALAAQPKRTGVRIYTNVGFDRTVNAVSGVLTSAKDKR